MTQHLYIVQSELFFQNCLYCKQINYTYTPYDDFYSL